MSNLIIVESESDKFFLKVLIEHLNYENVTTPEIMESFRSDNDFNCLNGLSKENLLLALQEIKKENYKNIGILIDADDVGINERVALVQEALISAGAEVIPSSMNELINCPNWQINLVIGITHVGGRGELETLLKEIKNKDSTHADCLDAWKECLKKKGLDISQKDFDKFWINTYFRYDTCDNEERKQAGKHCTKEAAYKKKNIWNLDATVLDNIKSFLKLVMADNGQ